MDGLRGDVTMLSHAEQRRFMRELNKQGGDVPSIRTRFLSKRRRHRSKSTCKKELSEILRLGHWLRRPLSDRSGLKRLWHLSSAEAAARR